MTKIGIIGGTGVYDPAILTKVESQVVNTPFGDIPVKTGEHMGIPVVFVARHGAAHQVPPHRVNYRGNIMAMKQLGVDRIIATGAVGSLNLEMRPGEFILVDQFIDFTKNRVQTFYDSGEQGIVHVDMTQPYCPEFRKIILDAACAAGIPVKDKGTYVCSEGPRFETPAEIKMFSTMGGDLVGMTSVPEVVLAREVAICYATIAMVTNFAAGISPTPLTHAEVMEAMETNRENLKTLVMKTIEIVPEARSCQCRDALKELGSLGQGK
ncbi:MAG: S-methyl-5'-thioadenosine phosphorylase [Thermincola sp.]|jgi:5'-methylthioadenosine phosphorylase|nr:S-methyl-5'-thioadenosine phosphorylase [Thermincola sp.]MDT3701509.1 S-methyl-5'-thioadenosine phosphorylase [Thermincola sp.]